MNNIAINVSHLLTAPIKNSHMAIDYMALPTGVIVYNYHISPITARHIADWSALAAYAESEALRVEQSKIHILKTA